MKRHLQCAEQQDSPPNVTKYCACHAKWLSCLILLTYETSFAMCGATRVTLQLHQILRLPRKIAPQNLIEICWKQMKRHLYIAGPIRAWSEHDPTMIWEWTGHLAPARSPRLVFTLRRRILYWNLQHFGLRRSTQISPNAAPDITCCACHEKWHCNIAKCCAGPGGKNDSHDSWLILLRQNELFLDWTVTEPLLYQTVTWLICYLTGLLLNCYLPEPLRY